MELGTLTTSPSLGILPSNHVEGLHHAPEATAEMFGLQPKFGMLCWPVFNTALGGIGGKVGRGVNVGVTVGVLVAVCTGVLVEVDVRVGVEVTVRVGVAVAVAF